MSIKSILKKLVSYEPKLKDDETLSSDLEIMRQWYTNETLKSEKLNLRRAYRELLSEIKDRALDIQLTDDESNILTTPDPEPIDPNFVRTVTNTIDDILFIPEFVSICGSVLSSDHPNDVDLVYKFDFSEELQNGITQMFPDKLKSKIHYISDKNGPRGTYLPIYDLVLVRRKDLSEKQAQPKLQLFDQVPPLRFGVVSSGNIQEIIDNVGDQAWIIHPDLGGEPLLIHRSKGIVLIMDADGNKINLPELNELILTKITEPSTFILAVNLLSDGSLVVSDILNWRGTDLVELSAFSRSVFLDKLELEEPFKIVDFEITHNPDSFNETLRTFKDKGIKSFVLKGVDSMYNLNGVSQEWVGITLTGEHQLSEINPLDAVATVKLKEFSENKMTFEKVSEALGNNIVVEDFPEGIRVSIHKKGDDIKIFASDGKADLSHKFPKIIDDIKSIADAELILDAILTEYTENFEEPLPKSEQLKWFVQNDLDDEWVLFTVIDILWRKE